MKKYLLVAVLLVAIGSAVGFLSASRGEAATMPAPGSPEAKEVAIAEQLRTAEFGDVSVTVTGTEAAVVLDKVAFEGTELEKGIQANMPYRAAASQGCTFLRLQVTFSDGRQWSDERAIWSNLAPHTDPKQAQQAIEKWVATVSAESGAIVDWSFDPAGYRLDTEVSGSPEQVREATSSIFNDGGYDLHQAGQLDLVTVTATLENKPVFIGFRDWIAMNRTICYEAADFGLEY
jgi:hypothetical protein